MVPLLRNSQEIKKHTPYLLMRHYGRPPGVFIVTRVCHVVCLTHSSHAQTGMNKTSCQREGSTHLVDEELVLFVLQCRLVILHELEVRDGKRL